MAPSGLSRLRAIGAAGGIVANVAFAAWAGWLAWFVAARVEGAGIATRLCMSAALMAVSAGAASGSIGAWLRFRYWWNTRFSAVERAGSWIVGDVRAAAPWPRYRRLCTRTFWVCLAMALLAALLERAGGVGPPPVR